MKHLRQDERAREHRKPDRNRTDKFVCPVYATRQNPPRLLESASLRRRSYVDRQDRHVEIPGPWQVRMFHLGREGWFNLDSANQTAAAKARDIYLMLVSQGWDATEIQTIITGNGDGLYRGGISGRRGGAI